MAPARLDIAYDVPVDRKFLASGVGGPLMLATVVLGGPRADRVRRPAGSIQGHVGWWKWRLRWTVCGGLTVIAISLLFSVSTTSGPTGSRRA